MPVSLSSYAVVPRILVAALCGYLFTNYNKILVNDNSQSSIHDSTVEILSNASSINKTYNILVLPSNNAHSLVTFSKLALEIATRGFNVTILVEKRLEGSLDEFLSLYSFPVSISIFFYDDSYYCKNSSGQNTLADALEEDISRAQNFLRNQTITASLLATLFDISLVDVADYFGQIISFYFQIPRVDIDLEGNVRTLSRYDMHYSPSYLPAPFSALPGGPYSLQAKFFNFLDYLIQVTYDQKISHKLDIFSHSLQFNSTIASTVSFRQANNKALLLSLWSADWTLLPAMSLPPFIKIVGPLHLEPPNALTLEILSILQMKTVLLSLSGYEERWMSFLVQAINATTSSMGLKLVVITSSILSSEVSAQIQSLQDENVTVLGSQRPLGDLLAHPNTTVLVSDCRTESVYTSILHGVPLLCLPTIRTYTPQPAEYIHAALGGVVIDQSAGRSAAEVARRGYGATLPADVWQVPTVGCNS